jgi:AraC-like DNA-binding protein
VGFHRGAVTCFLLALDGRLEVNAAAPTATSGRVVSALVGAGLRHEVRVSGTRAAFLYLEPTDPLATRLRGAMRAVHPRLHVGHRGAGAFVRALTEGAGLDAFPALHPSLLDPRIQRVLRGLGTPGGRGSGVDAAARSVGLSESRFMHLFREQVGVPFRRYRLWARLHAAVRHATGGALWTDAALEGGFSSPSHLSDAFRAMFGVPPSVLGAAQVSYVP